MPENSRPKEQAKTVFDLKDPNLYINRELSQLEVFRRVLEEAQDESHPLLERVKFLAIVGSIMDEFFMVRVGGLKLQADTGVVDLSIDGLTPAEQLASIRKLSLSLMQTARTCWHKDLHPRLKKAGVHILNYDELNAKQTQQVQDYFEEMIFPALTPLAVDPGHPFPHISNLSQNLAIMIRDQAGEERFARLKVPNSLPRLVPLKRSSGSVRADGTVPHNHYFVWVHQVISANLHRLFPGMEIIEAHPFRVIRNADMVIQELEADDLLEAMSASVRDRRFGSVIYMAVQSEMPPRLKEILIENLEMDARDIYVLDNPLGLGSLMSLAQIDRYDLRDQPFQPALPLQLRSEYYDGNLFNAIKRENILLHHPYDSFDPVVDFIKSAARDPNVVAIKQTLYRVGRNAPVVNALLEARREYGKEVAVLVELKARFDEESNISWAKALEREGVHVIYGLLGLKTHSKIALVVRREGDTMRRYLHLGTGNYNVVTATIYEDFGLFTADEALGADASDLFNYLTGYSAKTDYRKMLVAPINLRSRMTALIQREIDLAKQGKPARLIFKMNSIVDKPMIRLLYEASQAGVKIDLVIRGICSLRPGIPGLSDNIRITSIIGRFLEHSRIYYFQNDGNEEVYMGSADLMTRNLDRRVEILFPIENTQMINHIRDDILPMYLADTRKARLMLPDGKYIRLQSDANVKEAINVQEWFLKSRQGQTR
ncbi:MAG: polyphosphate kinase 1 [Anaerolineales bacterium]|nr:polyphosphate kinase 1 [Anaerolineales bacterium]